MAFDDIATRGLVLLGCGKMGGALLEGWLAAGLPPEAFHIRDPKPGPQLGDLVARGLHLNADLPQDPAVAVIAVKPQMIGEALPALAAMGGGGTLFLSIAAGTTLATFEGVLGAASPIVRAMPNTPAAVGRGISALIGNAAATAAHLDLAEALMAAVGETVRLEAEAQMDAVTGLSGSGPAYVFHLIETMAAAGAAEGLDPELAMRLAVATVAGAGHLAATSGETAAQLRINVTSPNGTTQAGLEVLMDAETGLPPLMRRTVAAATARSKALSG